MKKPETTSHLTINVDRDLYRLEVSRYDRVSGVLISLLVLLGLAVFLMFIVWLTNRVFVHHTPPPVLAAEIAVPEEAWGISDDILPPHEEEEDVLDEEIEELLEAVTDAVSTRTSLMSKMLPGDDTGRGGSGMDPRGKGVSRNWELQFIEGNTLQTYAEQLDFFKIELGVLRPGGTIEYASNLSAKRPRTNAAPADQETRYYLTWRRGNLKEADRELLRKAGIEPGRDLIFKFLPPQVEARLFELEKTKAAGRDKRIRMTRFGILPDGDGYKFYVMRQSYRY